MTKLCNDFVLSLLQNKMDNCRLHLVQCVASNALLHNVYPLPNYAWTLHCNGIAIAEQWIAILYVGALLPVHLLQ